MWLLGLLFREYFVYYFDIQYIVVLYKRISILHIVSYLDRNTLFQFRKIKKFINCFPSPWNVLNRKFFHLSKNLDKIFFWRHWKKYSKENFLTQVKLTVWSFQGLGLESFLTFFFFQQKNLKIFQEKKSKKIPTKKNWIKNSKNYLSRILISKALFHIFSPHTKFE